MSMLEVRTVTQRYGVSEVLRDIDLQVRAGESVALVGPSGCGKTTLLNLCAGLLPPTTGGINSGFERTACVFQQPRLLPWKSALDNIALGLKALGTPAGERARHARELALRMGLAGDDLDKYPHQLSGGMQSRIALARAFAVAPDLLLLDEPFSALDIGLKAELHALLLEYATTRRTAVLMVTHDLMEAVRLSQRILLMSAPEHAPGRIVWQVEFDRPFARRDDAWVYHNTAQLLATAQVRHAFSLAPVASPDTGGLYRAA
ncbi:MAG: ABC transporter ATP-binding protein [Rhodocyclales bacterium]|nr:ABC transporter ATP-binding protein [Rhodocyclales bacterium]